MHSMGLSSYTQFRVVPLSHLPLSEIRPTAFFASTQNQMPHAYAGTVSSASLSNPVTSFSEEREGFSMTENNVGKVQLSVLPRDMERVSNLRKWHQFGLDTSHYYSNRSEESAVAPVAATLVAPAGEQRDRIALALQSKAVASARDVYDVDSTPEEESHHPLHDTRSPPQSSPHLSSEPGVSPILPHPTTFATLRKNLGELSKQVNSAQEEDRCRPPKKQPRKASLTHALHSKGAEDGDGEEHVDDASTTQPSRSVKTSGGARKKPKRPGGKQDKGGLPPRSAKYSSVASADVSGPMRSKRKRSDALEGQPESGVLRVAVRKGVGKCNNEQALFLLPEPPISTTPLATPRGGAMGSSAAARAQVPYERLPNSAELFSDIEEALHDPDRIQSPPLYASLLFQARDASLYSNLSLSAATHGKAIMLPAPDLQAAQEGQSFLPSHVHYLVRDVVIRWKDRVYVMDALSIGFDFLLRVLRELTGVELITFNAPAFLLPLLSYTQGVLFTTCVSDIRVMAWMLSLSDNNSVLKQDADAITDFHALIHICGISPAPANAPPGVGTNDTLQALVHDTFYFAPVYRALYGRLGSQGLLQAFLRQEKRISILISAMKLHGMRIDLKEVQRFKEACTEDMVKWRELATAMVGTSIENFNIQSPDHCRKAIYEIFELGKYLLPRSPALPSTDATTPHQQQQQPFLRGNGVTAGSAVNLTLTKCGKLSTAEDMLRVLGAYHPFPRYVINYRKAAKLLQTYVEGMMSYVLPCCGSAWKEACEAHEEGKEDTFMDHALAYEVSRSNGLQKPCGAEDSSRAVDGTVSAPESAASLKVREAWECMTAEAADISSSKQKAEVAMALTDCHGYAMLHPNFIQEGTDTGRFSCVEPNLQNLPRASFPIDNDDVTLLDHSEDRLKSYALADVTLCAGTHEAGNETLKHPRANLTFRRCFVAPPGYTLLSADYEQIELRVLAHLCGDAALIDALTHSADIHRSIAEVLFKKRAVTDEERNLAKRVVFGVLYGAGPRTLSSQMNVSVEKAMEVSALLQGSFPHVHQYHERVIDQGRMDNFVRTISGRVRYLPDLNSSVMGKRSYAERQAFNTVIQGSAADIMKMAMLAVEQEVLKVYTNEVLLLIQIHDEMVFAVKQERLRSVVACVTTAMSRAMSLLVPLRVNVKVGSSLGNLEPWSVEHEFGIR